MRRASTRAPSSPLAPRIMLYRAKRPMDASRRSRSPAARTASLRPRLRMIRCFVRPSSLTPHPENTLNLHRIKTMSYDRMFRIRSHTTVEVGSEGLSNTMAIVVE